MNPLAPSAPFQHAASVQQPELVVRPYEPVDEQAYLDLRMPWERLFDEAEVRALAQGRREPIARFQVAVRAGAVVGSAIVHPSLGGLVDTCFGLVLVAPQARRQGVGGRLLADLLEALPGQTVMGVVHDDDGGSLEATRRWGFEQLTHGIAAQWQVGPVQTPEPPPGVRLVVRHAWGDLPEGFEVLLRESDTSPESEIGAPVALAELTEVFPEPVVVVALVEDVPAAVAVGGRQPSGRWLVGYTGVRPAFRRRGLARLVKLRLHAQAASEGARVLATLNEAGNTGIRALNAELGYVVTGGEIRVRRRP